MINILKKPGMHEYNCGCGCTFTFENEDVKYEYRIFYCNLSVL